MPAYAFNDNQLSGLSNASVSQLSGFEIKDLRPETKPQMPLTLEEQAIVNEIIHGGPKIGGRNAELERLYLPEDQLVDSFWLSKSWHGVDYKTGPEGRFSWGVRMKAKKVEVTEDGELTLEGWSDNLWNSIDGVHGTGVMNHLIVKADALKLKVGKYCEIKGEKSWMEPITEWTIRDIEDYEIEVIIDPSRYYGSLAQLFGNPQVTDLTITTDNITVY